MSTATTAPTPKAYDQAIEALKIPEMAEWKRQL